MYDVKVLNHYGVWQTDLVTGSQHRACERGRFLLPRVPAVKVEYMDGRRLNL